MEELAHPVVACYRGLDSADAIQLASLLAGALAEPLVLANTVRHDHGGPGARAAPEPAGRRGLAQAALRRARAIAAGEAVARRRAEAARAACERARANDVDDIDVRELDAPAGAMPTALVELVREVAACAVVVGRDSQGRVTRSVLSLAPCPVAIAPLGVALSRIGPFARIGVACDGSPTARWALVAATHLALATGARLELLAAAATTKHAAAWLQIARQHLAGAVDHDERALVGDPATMLTQASAELDLLACGACGRDEPLAPSLGGVSRHLIEHAACPLLVVPPVVWRSDSGPLGLTCAQAEPPERAVPQSPRPSADGMRPSSSSSWSSDR